jgi:pseudaminic acid synthase
VNIGGIEIGQGNPCRFVAEISNNHNGSLVQAFRLIEAAKNAGADFVKFQCYTPDELVELRGDGAAPEPWGSQGWTMRTLYEKAQTPLSWFPMLFQRARDIGLVPFSSVFGLESRKCLESVGNPCYKVARLDNQHRWLIEAAKDRGKPVLISCDGQALSLAEVLDAGEGVHWLHCPPGYPAEIRPREVGWFTHDDPVIGISSHCLHPLLPIAAVARGCKLIEMHFQLDDAKSELESEVSLTASGFREMVDAVREVEAMLA